MPFDLLLAVAGAAGAAAAGAVSAYWMVRSRGTLPGFPNVPQQARTGTAYVRLSAEDSDRLEKMGALLERLLALEEQTQLTLARLGEQVNKVRLEETRRYGVIRGRLDDLARRGQQPGA